MRFNSILVIVMATIISVSSCMAAAPMSTFIQLNRDIAEKTTGDWIKDMKQMHAIGIDSVIVQWCAEPGVLYFESDDLEYDEQYPALERIIKAATDQKMKVCIGLYQDPDYWTQITARDRVLRDYFLVRIVKNEAVQKALIKEFGNEDVWTGYYIPDEIDDLTWRQPGKSKRIKQYLELLCKRLRLNDSSREINISAFFRGRTAPDIFMNNMESIVTSNTVDNLLLQDGAGNLDPSLQYTHIYYRVFKEKWPENYAKLGCVIELFQQESKDDEPFRAVPASPDRVEKQFENATNYFDNIVLFTFSDYADPDLNKTAKKLYDYLKSR